MKRTIISLLLAAALVFSMSVAAIAAPFPDVKEDNEYANAIDLLASLNILGGYEDGSFRPDSNITRAELSKMLYVVFGGSDDPMANLYAGASQFSDVPRNAWFNGHVNWASENGIVGGYGDGTFLPDNNVAVKEAVKMVVSAVTEKSLTYPMGYIQEAKALGLLDDVNVGDTNAYATRGQIAQMTFNLLYTPSRLCLKATGDIDSNGNEVYKKTAPIEFVFGLTAFGGQNSETRVELLATYENMWTHSGTLEEGQVAVKIGDRTYTFDYEGDANSLFGQDLTAYLDTATITGASKLISLVSNSSVYTTTSDKLTGNGSSAYPFRVDGKALAVGSYVTSGNTKFYAFDTVYTQNSNGSFSKQESSESNYLKVADYFSKDGNNSSDIITLIDRDSDGTYETIVIKKSGTVKVTAYSASSKTIKVSPAIAGKTQFSSINVNGFDAFAGLDYSAGADAVYANYSLQKRGDSQICLDMEVAKTVVGKLESVASNGMSAVVDGKTYESVGNKSASGVRGVFADVAGNIGDNVKVYFDANGYAAAVAVTEEAATYELSLGKVISAQDNADKWGNNVTASIKVVLSDGTEKTIEIAADEDKDDTLTSFDGSTAEAWLTDGSGEEVFFAYDTQAKDYKIVGQYIHFEIDDDTEKAARIVAIEDIESEGGPTNTTLEWEVKDYENNLSYNDKNGFFIGDEKRVTEYVGYAADNFVGMYYEENESGEIESAYYNESNIPEFYQKGSYTLVFADGEVAAMIITQSPEATSAEKILGVITSWMTVSGENKTANGTSTYRTQINMIVGGEAKTYYTEDAVANKIVNATEDNEKLQAGRLVYIQLLSNGKVAVKDASDGKIMVDLEYLTYGNTQFGYASYNRGSYYRIFDVEGVKNAVEAGWVLDDDGNMIYNEEAVSGSVTAASSYSSLMVCDETEIYSIAAKAADFSAEDAASNKMLQDITGVSITKLDSIPVSDVNNGIMYIFFYTVLTEDTADNSDNAGAIGTVYVFDVPVVTD